MAYPRIDNENELLEKISGGDERSFNLIVKTYWQNIYAHALAYLHSAARAEELTQDVFVNIWKNRRRLPQVDNFPNYLFITVRNRIISEVRKKVRDSIATGSGQDDALAENELDKLDNKELLDIIMQGISQLPTRRRQVFEMSRLQGKTYAEIASELNISKDTVSEYIVLALQFLRAWLSKHYGKTTAILILSSII